MNMLPGETDEEFAHRLQAQFNHEARVSQTERDANYARSVELASQLART